MTSKANFFIDFCLNTNILLLLMGINTAANLSKKEAVGIFAATGVAIIRGLENDKSSL